MLNKRFAAFFISTHALTWSATQTFAASDLDSAFQLTHSRGVRLTHSPYCAIIIKISTHALTWSATLNIVLKKDSPHSIWEFIAFYHQLS